MNAPHKIVQLIFFRVADECEDPASLRTGQRSARHEPFAPTNHPHPPATYVMLQGCFVIAAHRIWPELDTKNSQSAIELLLTHSSLLEALRKAYMGNYGVILSLLGCLEHGVKAKKLVDKVIDVLCVLRPSHFAVLVCLQI